MISGEALLIGSAVFAAAVLSSLAPPPPAFALQNSALANVGPGRVAQTVKQDGYVLQVLVSPNKAVAPDSFALRITKNGAPVRAANVTLDLQPHRDADAPTGIPTHRNPTRSLLPHAPALVMVGKWALGVPDHPQDRHSHSPP